MSTPLFIFLPTECLVFHFLKTVWKQLCFSLALRVNLPFPSWSHLRTLANELRRLGSAQLLLAIGHPADGQREGE